MAATSELAFKISHANKASVRADWFSVNISKVEVPPSTSANSVLKRPDGRSPVSQVLTRSSAQAGVGLDRRR